MAISVTVTSIKISVTATDVAGNTIDDIYQAVALSGFPALMVRTGVSAPYTYSIPVQTELEFLNGTYIKDYTSGGGILIWASRTQHITSMFDLQSGSKLELGPDWIIDFEKNSTYYTYIYAYGCLVFQGTAGHPVIIKHYYILYCYTQSSTNFWDWDWVSCEDMVYGNGNWLVIQLPIYKPEHSFKNVTFSNTGVPYGGRGYIYISGTMDLSAIEFDNLIFNNTSRAFHTQGSCIKITNSILANCALYPLTIDGCGSGQWYKKTSNSEYDKYTYQQAKFTFDNCLFSDNYGIYEQTAGIIRSGTVKFKNCTFDEIGSPPATYGVMSSYNASCLYEGITDMTNVTNKYQADYGGSHFDCKTLTLKVTDAGGAPIEGAVISLIEESGRLNQQIITRSTGYIKDLFGDDPVLPYREITNAIGTTFANWDTYTINVSYQGYTLNVRTGIDMTSDQNIVVSLTTTPEGATTIYGSTFYGSTIY